MIYRTSYRKQATKTALPRGLSQIPTDSAKKHHSFVHEHLLSFTVNNIKPSEFSPPALVMAIRTARRTTCHDWAFKGCKVQDFTSVQP